MPTRGFKLNAGIAGALIVFLFVIDMLASDEWWFQWPALVILLIFALRTIFLFRKRDPPALHRFYMNSATAGTLIAFLFGIDMFTDGPFWFQWPAMAILLVYALRTIFLFRKRII